MTGQELANLKGTKECVINNFIKGTLQKTMSGLINKGHISFEKINNTFNKLIVKVDDMPIISRRQVFCHSLLKDRLK